MLQLLFSVFIMSLFVFFAFYLGCFYVPNNLVLTRNLWSVISVKILLLIELHQILSKILRIPNMCLFFLLLLWLLLWHFLISQDVKVVNLILDLGCHYVAETGSWFFLITACNSCKLFICIYVSDRIKLKFTDSSVFLFISVSEAIFQ